MGEDTWRWVSVGLGLLGSGLLGWALVAAFGEFAALNGLGSVLPGLLVVLAIALIMAAVSLWGLREKRWVSIVQLVVGMLVGILGFGTYHPPILGPLLLGAGASWVAAALVGWLAMRSGRRLPTH